MFTQYAVFTSQSSVYFNMSSKRKESSCSFQGSHFLRKSHRTLTPLPYVKWVTVWSVGDFHFLPDWVLQNKNWNWFFQSWSVYVNLQHITEYLLLFESHDSSAKRAFKVQFNFLKFTYHVQHVHDSVEKQEKLASKTGITWAWGFPCMTIWCVGTSAVVLT